MNPASVRKDIAQMVASEATTMAQAVIDEGKKGQLATVKYLFEVAEIYPASTDGSHATVDEDCLARTLLNRMDVPDEPVGRDEEDEPKAATSTNQAAAKPAGKDEGASDAEPKAENENRELVVA